MADLPSNEQERVLRAQLVPLVRDTKAGLLETVQQVLAQEGRVQRIEYIRGELLRVERMVRPNPADDPEMFTPFQMVRQHAEVHVEDGEAARWLHILLRAFKRLARLQVQPIFLLCRREAELDRVIFPKGAFTVKESFHLPIYEDPEVPSGVFFVAGSSIGTLLADTEIAIMCVGGAV